MSLCIDCGRRLRRHEEPSGLCDVCDLGLPEPVEPGDEFVAKVLGQRKPTRFPSPEDAWVAMLRRELVPVYADNGEPRHADDCAFLEADGNSLCDCWLAVTR